MKINFQPTRKTQRLTILIVCIFVLAGILVTWTPIHAAMGITDRILMWVTYPFFMILSLLGKLLVVLINIMLAFVQFNNFVDTTAVQKGWVVVRDMCNVFLVLILLAISWGTVLRIESYHYKRTLPKFIIMAFLLNFSKTIAGFFIDLCQVIMNTFTSRFADAAAANLTTSSGLQKVLMFAQETDTGAIASVGEAFAAVALGIFLLLFMIGAVLMIIFILLGRIIVLWILVVLSPLAYLGEMISPLKKAATQWWSTFGNYVTVGPIIAFYLWLAMAVMATNPGNVGREITQGIPEGTRAFVEAGQQSTGLAAGISEMSTSDNLMSYFVTIGLLYAAVMAAQQTRTLGSGLGSKVAGGMAAATGAWLARAPGTAYAWGARKIKSGALPGRVGKGLEFNPVNVYRNIKEGMVLKRAKEEREGKIFAEERLRKGGFLAPISGAGAPSLVETYMQGLFYNHGFKTWGRRIPQGRAERRLTEGEEKLNVAKSRMTSYEEAHKDEIDARTGELMANDKDLSEEVARARATKEIGGEEYKQLTALRDQEARAVASLKEVVAKYEAYKPRDFMAQQLRRAQDAEESKKYNTSSEEELISLMKGAIARGDMAAARAILLQAARVGHENEVVNYSYKPTEDYYEHREKGLMSKTEFDDFTKGMSADKIKEEFEHGGQAIIKAGEQLPSGLQGMHAFIREAFIKKLKMNQQVAYALENDVSNVAEQTGHWNVGQAIGTTSDGTLHQRSRKLQNLRVDTEMGKQDFETALRRFNRLGFMDEYLKDPTNPESERYGKLTGYGAKMIAEKWPAIASSIGKERFNVSNARHLTNEYNQGLLTGPIREMVDVQAGVEQNNIDVVTRYFEANRDAIKKSNIDAETPAEFQAHYKDFVMENYDVFLSKLRDFAGKEGMKLDNVDRVVTGYSETHQEAPATAHEPPVVL